MAYYRHDTYIEIGGRFDRVPRHHGATVGHRPDEYCYYYRYCVKQHLVSTDLLRIVSAARTFYFLYLFYQVQHRIMIVSIVCGAVLWNHTTPVVVEL